MSDKNATEKGKITVNTRELQLVMQEAYLNKDSLMIWGKPGIGKSEISKQFADKYFPIRTEETLAFVSETRKRAENETDDKERKYFNDLADRYESSLLDQEFNFIDIRLSTKEPTDIQGIPIKVTAYKLKNGSVVSSDELGDREWISEVDAVRWIADMVFQLPDNWKGVIIFDEITSAMPIIQAASYQIFLERKINDVKIPDGAFIIAAGNNDTDGGITFNMATPLRDRMTHIELVENFEVWRDDYAFSAGLYADVIGFLTSDPSKYFHTLSPKSDDKSGGASPRSWKVVSDYCKSWTKRGIPINSHNNIVRSIIAGRVGYSAAKAFLLYVDEMFQLPTVDDVLVKYNFKLPDNFDTAKQYYMISLLANHLIELTNKMKDTNLSPAEVNAIKDEIIAKRANYNRFLVDEFHKKHQRELVIVGLITIVLAHVPNDPNEENYKFIRDEYYESMCNRRGIIATK